MSHLDKLLKVFTTKNVAENVDEETRKKIAQSVVNGSKVDNDSRATWLAINQEAMKIIKHCEADDGEKDFPFPGAAQVVYPLLAPAVIQLAARLATHIVQNDQVCRFAVLGPDYQVPVITGQQGQQASQQDPNQPQQPPKLEYKKEAQAKRLTDYASYDFLINSDTWLNDTHKLMAILAGWGTAFRQVYYDRISKRPCHELIAPEDVIINHGVTSLEKAPRITVRNYLRKNDIVSFINSGDFLDIDLENIETDSDTEYEDSISDTPDSREENPTHEFLCQMLYLDLDDDGYAEPYKAYVHKKREELFGLYPAFKMKDVEFDKESGKILRIKPRIDIVDFHCIDDPEGKFYSIGLNYLLTHQNKSITSILRQLIDSGTLQNTQGGFITKAFKTQEKSLSFEMGEFKVLDCDYNVNPQQHIFPLPFKEPSQVLLALLQTLIQAGKETGFITDVLTGDVESQNTPATTMLAAVEQGTRAFKPIIQKLYVSLKKEFKLWFDINSEYLDVNEQGQKYATFQGRPVEVSREDFNSDELDVCPVADPTMSSEAHKYARIRFITELFASPVASGINIPEALKTVFEGLQFTNAEQLVNQPQPPPPDPKMVKLQLDSKKQDDKVEMDHLKLELQQRKQENEELKTKIQAFEAQTHARQAQIQDKVMTATVLKDHIKDHKSNVVDHRLAKVAEDKVNVDREKLVVMEKKSRDSGSST